jgi:DNA-binding beta-propeller fold protein YncE
LEEEANMIGSTIVVINNQNQREVTEGSVILAVSSITVAAVVGVFVIGAAWKRWRDRK